MVQKYYIYIFLSVLFFKSPFAFTSEEFVFKKADAFRILIFDNNMVPESNRILSSFHNIDFIIDGDGYVQLGSFGQLYVANISVDRVTELLEGKFKTYGKDLSIIVIPLIRLVLKGEFGSPGMYRFSPNTSFWDVVSAAGGLSSNLAAENMYVMRHGEIIYAEFWDSLYSGTSIRELGLESGDEVIVPRVNRISLEAIMRYVNFFASLILLYYALNDNN